MPATNRYSLGAALIGAAASIVVAWITANYSAKTSVKQGIKKIAVRESNIWQARDPNQRYPDIHNRGGGIVIAIAHADPNHRMVSIQGLINGALIAGADAQDSTVSGVPSISTSSFTMPVPAGLTWEVKVPPADAGQVEIKWFATKIILTPEAR